MNIAKPMLWSSPTLFIVILNIRSYNHINPSINFLWYFLLPSFNFKCNNQPIYSTCQPVLVVFTIMKAGMASVCTLCTCTCSGVREWVSYTQPGVREPPAGQTDKRAYNKAPSNCHYVGLQTRKTDWTGMWQSADCRLTVNQNQWVAGKQELLVETKYALWFDYW
jgi:hypothetical protein